MRSKITLALLGTTLLFTLCCTTSCNKKNKPDYDIVDETYVHKYGVDLPAEDWTARGEDGQVISTLSNGVVVTKSYSKGSLEGNSFYTYPHSKVVEKVEIYANDQIDKEIAYSPSGIPTQETIFLKDGRKEITIWYEDGSPKSVEEYDAQGLLSTGEYFDIHHQKDGQVNGGEGIRVKRDMYGQLESRENIQKGELVNRTTYHSMGTPNVITPFHKGFVHGQCRTFLPAGEPNTIEEWKDGKREGLCVQYNNGEKFADVPYVNGIRVGIERHYRDGTDVVQEITWKNDMKHGPSTTYVNGTKQTEWFYKGEPISKANYDNLNGALTQ